MQALPDLRHELIYTVMPDHRYAARYVPFSPAIASMDLVTFVRT